MSVNSLSSQQQSAVKVISISGGKGGVGKTNISVNLSIALARLGEQVMLLDGDLGLANIDVMLGLHSNRNLSHVLDGSTNLSEILLTGPDNIQIIPASSGISKMASLTPTEHAGLINAFSGFSGNIDTLIIDTAAGISPDVINFIKASQEHIIVVCNEPTSITDAYALIKVLSVEHNLRHFRVVANMVRSMVEGRELFAKLQKTTDRFLDIVLDYVGEVPFDEHVHKAVQKQKALLSLYPGSKAGKAYSKMADQVSSWQITDNLNGNVSFFIEQIVANQG